MGGVFFQNVGRTEAVLGPTRSKKKYEESINVRKREREREREKK